MVWTKNILIEHTHISNLLLTYSPSTLLLNSDEIVGLYMCHSEKCQEDLSKSHFFEDHFRDTDVIS